MLVLQGHTLRNNKCLHLLPLILLGDPYKIENCHCLKSFQGLVILESILFKKKQSKDKNMRQLFLKNDIFGFYISALYSGIYGLYFHLRTSA